MSDTGLEPTRERVALALVLGVACLAGGAYLGYDAVEATVNSEAVDAVVVDSGVSAVSGTEREYRVDVTYEYDYRGDTYTSDNVFAGTGADDRFSSRGTAESFVADYPEDETVTAHVDPNDPSSAYLEGGIRLRTLAGAAVAIVIGVVSLLGGTRQLLALSGDE